MKTEITIQGLAASLSPARSARKIIGFVPTMGNLHEGHLNLVREARKLCDVVVVSIFVNPIQFGPNEDFDSYPRTLEQDQRLLAEAGCDIVFAPSVEQMYGNKPRLTNITVGGISQFVRDLNIPLEVIGVPIARAADGLALSSRNGYLSPENRAVAPKIYQSLKAAEQQLQAGAALPDALQNMKAALTEAGFAVDYVEARAPDLQKIEQFNQDIVLFAAAKLGATRLIDNLQVKYPAS